MKKLTKLIFSCAAVAAVTAAVGTAALADGFDTAYVGTPTLQTNIAEFLNGTLGITDAQTGDEQTVLIYKVSNDVADATTVNPDENNIEYINQKTGAITEAFLKKAVDAPATYVVRVGGDADGVHFKEAVIKVTEQGGQGPGTVQITIGDIDGVNGADGDDASLIAQHTVGLTTLTGKQFRAAYTRNGYDTDTNPTLGVGDAGNILNYAAAGGAKVVEAIGTTVEYTE